MILHGILFLASLGISILLTPLILYGRRGSSEFRSRRFFAENGALPAFLVLGNLLALNNFSQGLTWDETFMTSVKNLPLPTGLASILYEIHPPLYRTVHLLLDLLLGDREEIIRAIPLFSFSASIWLLYRTVSVLRSRATAVIACFLFVPSPIVIRYAQEAKAYSLLTALFLFVLCILADRRVSGRFRKFQVFGILLASMHIVGFVANALLNLALLLQSRRAFRSLLRAYAVQLIFVLPSYFHILLFQLLGRVAFDIPSVFRPEYADRLEISQLLNLPATYLLGLDSPVFSVLVVAFIAAGYLLLPRERGDRATFELPAVSTGILESVSLVAGFLLLAGAAAVSILDLAPLRHLFRDHRDVFAALDRLGSIACLCYAVLYFGCFAVLRFLRGAGGPAVVTFGDGTVLLTGALLAAFALVVGLFTERNFIYFSAIFAVALGGSLAALRNRAVIAALLLLILACNVGHWELARDRGSGSPGLSLIPTGTLKEAQFRRLFAEVEQATGGAARAVIHPKPWKLENIARYYGLEYAAAARSFDELPRDGFGSVCVFNGVLSGECWRPVGEAADDHKSLVIRCYQRIADCDGPTRFSYTSEGGSLVDD